MLKDIEKELARLEPQARQLEPSSELRKEYQEKVIDYSNEFLDQIETLPAYIQTKEKGKGIRQFSITDEPAKLDDLIHAIQSHIDIPGLNPASGGHLGYIPGGGIFPSALADYLGAVMNRYAGIFYASPGAVRLENMMIDWLKETFHFPSDTLGNLTTGGSLANLMGIVSGREGKGIRVGDIPTSVIYLSEQVHHSVDKAIRIAGLVECPVRYIDLDDEFRLDPNALEAAIDRDTSAGLKPFLIVASVGTTNTGAVDPIEEISKISLKNNCWLHIDAAYGGFFALSNEGKIKVKDLHLADSLVVDPHKGLFLPYGLGVILVKNGEYLHKAHYYQASYLQDAASLIDEPSPADLSPELTKHFRGLRMWLPLKLFGLKPFIAALDEKIWLCRYFYESIKNIERFEVGPYPELSVMIFRYIPRQGDANEFNEKLLVEVVRDGRVFLSSTMIRNHFFIRLAVLSFRTHKSTIDLCLEILKQKVNTLESMSEK